MILLSICSNSSHFSQQKNNQFVTEFYVLLENSDRVNFKTSVWGAAIGELDRILNNA
jgi:hypothetical protein